METPRPLTPREREVLDFLVSIDDPAAEALRIQATTAQVTEECECGCGGISLTVDREGTPRADLGSQKTKVHGWRVETKVFRCRNVTSSNDPEDPEETQWLILWTEDGWIEGDRDFMGKRLTTERPSLARRLCPTLERPLGRHASHRTPSTTPHGLRMTPPRPPCPAAQPDSLANGFRLMLFWRGWPASPHVLDRRSREASGLAEVPP
jgi:hypothetical protein